MVDALRRVHRMLQPRGWVIDIHPTATRSAVQVDGRDMGLVEAGDAPARHAAADAAIHAAIREGLFAIAHTGQFEFYTYADSVQELRDYVESTWRNARVAEDVVRRAEAALHVHPGARPRVREEVRITKLILATGRR